MNPKDGGAFAEAQRTQHALQRYGTAEEIAAGVVFLASPAAVVRDRHGAEMSMAASARKFKWLMPGAWRARHLPQNSNQGNIP